MSCNILLKKLKQQEEKIKKQIMEQVYRNIRTRIAQKRERLFHFKLQFLNCLKLDKQMKNIEKKLYAAISSIPKEYTQEFYLLLNEFIHQDKSSIHIRNNICNMDRDLAKILRHIIIKYELSQRLKWLVRLSDANNYFYQQVEIFRKEFTIINYNGERELDLVDSSLYFCQWLKGHTQSEKKIKTLSLIQNIIQKQQKEILEETMKTDGCISKTTLTRHIANIIDTIHSVQYRYLLFEPFVYHLRQLIQLKQIFLGIMKAKTRRTVHKIIVNYELYSLLERPLKVNKRYRHRWSMESDYLV
jgi:hypothetical protein